ncbi:MAG: TolC family protein [Mariprofundaceae bacterium]|nr:TolC family protein [Mariprofundaceae bacterium]
MQRVINPYIFSFLIIIFPSLIMADEPLTLKQAETLAVQQNPGLAATGRQAEAMSNVSAQVGSLPDPVLSLNALNLPVDSFSTTAENMTQLQMGISQAIPFPGKLGLRASVADFMADAAALDVDEFKLRLIAHVKSSWWNIFYLDHALETIARNQQLLRQFIRIAETKYKVGQGLQQDVLLAQLELSKLLDVAIQLKSARKQQEARFNALLNRPARLSITLPQTADESLPALASEEELAELAIKYRPLLAKHERFIDAAHNRVALAEKDYYPDFNLGGIYGFRSGVNPANNRSRPDFSTLRLSMTLPFFTSSKQDHQLDQRKAELARTEFSSQDAKEAVLSEVSQVLAAYQRAKEQTLLFKTGIIPQATQTVASMLAGYQVNKVDFLNLVRSQVTLYNYETQYWKVLAEANQSLANLDAAVGRSVQ